MNMTFFNGGFGGLWRVSEGISSYYVLISSMVGSRYERSTGKACSVLGSGSEKRC